MPRLLWVVSICNIKMFFKLINLNHSRISCTITLLKVTSHSPELILSVNFAENPLSGALFVSIRFLELARFAARGREQKAAVVIH